MTEKKTVLDIFFNTKDMMNRYATKGGSSDSGRKDSSSSFKTSDSAFQNYDPEQQGKAKGFQAFTDRFFTLEDVSNAIRQQGIEHCSLMFGIDYTLSNRVQGEHSFEGRSLHDVSQPKANPYQQVICILGETLEKMNDSDTIPAFGFGDKITKDQGIFPLKECGECDSFGEVLETYDEITPTIKLGGPTNFAPLIDKAVEIVKEKKRYHILVIVADGQVTSEEATIRAIVEASEYPLSIIMIGVGDGPWDVMKEFDLKLPQRKFDNFRFVEYHATCSDRRNPQAAFALSALQLIPDQYHTIKRLRLLESI